MKKSRFTGEPIAFALRQAEVVSGNAAPPNDSQRPLPGRISGIGNGSHGRKAEVAFGSVPYI